MVSDITSRYESSNYKKKTTCNDSFYSILLCSYQLLVMKWLCARNNFFLIYWWMFTSGGLLNEEPYQQSWKLNSKGRDQELCAWGEGALFFLRKNLRSLCTISANIFHNAFESWPSHIKQNRYRNSCSFNFAWGGGEEIPICTQHDLCKKEREKKGEKCHLFKVHQFQ